MIRAATSACVKRGVMTAARLSGLGRRFSGRADVGQAIAAASRLRSRGLLSSLFYLGEYARQASIVDDSVMNSIAAARALATAGLDVHVSIDPTSVGYSLDDSLGMQNARRIGDAVRSAGGAGRKCLMLDMEDYSLLERTLALETALARDGIPVAVTLQAYLHRTADDLASIVRRGGSVLLVKGAFAEREPRAWQSPSEIDRNYLALADMMLSAGARDSGFFPSFGTHDGRLIASIRALARNRRWTPGSYEFEFLYGVKMKLAEHLAAEGETVRLYLHFGRDWWPYVARRIGENPRYLLNV